MRNIRHKTKKFSEMEKVNENILTLLNKIRFFTHCNVYQSGTLNGTKLEKQVHTFVNKSINCLLKI